MAFVFIFLSFTVWASDSIPVVDTATFTEGKSWTWEYFNEANELHSTERYTVVKVRKDQKVLIEMATQFPGQTEFTTHHRLLVQVDRCLRAYRYPSRKMPWSYRMFYKDSGGWQDLTPPNTLAFEEKFNCNPHHHDSRELLTEFKDSEQGRLFRHQRLRTKGGTWFHADGEQSAVAAEKFFKRTPGNSYYFRLRR